MIEEFKTGYYYKWIGKGKCPLWSKEMKVVLNGKWHKCLHGKKDKSRFENMIEWYYWYDKDLKYFVESKYPPEWKIRKLLNEN
jgi:hypothetical protein